MAYGNWLKHEVFMTDTKSSTKTHVKLIMLSVNIAHLIIAINGVYVSTLAYSSKALKPYGVPDKTGTSVRM